MNIITLNKNLFKTALSITLFSGNIDLLLIWQISAKIGDLMLTLPLA
jgi:hypothetical protein